MKTAEKKPKQVKKPSPIPTSRALATIEVLETAPLSSGKTNLLKHLQGGRLTRNQAILGRCCDCMGYYIDGKVSCEMPACTLFTFMPYRNKGVA